MNKNDKNRNIPYSLHDSRVQEIKFYNINKYSLKYVTTGDILVEAFRKGPITEQEGNTIWQVC